MNIILTRRYLENIIHNYIKPFQGLKDDLSWGKKLAVIIVNLDFKRNENIGSLVRLGKG